MSEKFPDLPNWSFETKEISNGCYVVRGRHRLGWSVERDGTDPDALLRDCRDAAIKMEAETSRIRASRGQAEI